MGEILRVATVPEDFDYSRSQIVTNTSFFDSTYSVSAMDRRPIDMPGNGEGTIGGNDGFSDLPEGIENFWAKTMVSFSASNNQSGFAAQAFDGSGEIIARVRTSGVGSTASARVEGSSMEEGVAVEQPSGLHEVAFNLITTETERTFRIYLNGVLASEATTGRGGLGYPRHFVFGGVLMNSGNTLRRRRLSEVVLTDDIDPRGLRVRTLTDGGAGHYSEWDGDPGSIHDDLLTTGLTTDTAGRRHSWEVDDVLSGHLTQSLFTIMQAVGPLTDPSGVRQFLRVGGSDYDGDFMEISEIVQRQPRSWPLNPATNQPWTASEIEAIEIGLLSANQ